MPSSLNEDDDIYHVPVLLEAVIEVFRPLSGKRLIDATLGGGGHTKTLAQGGATILAIDLDQEAIDASLHWRDEFPLVSIAKGSFEQIKAIAQANKFIPADGLLFDLGVSSHQLESPNRGFSFRLEGPLDMRMTKDFGVTAADLVNTVSEKQLQGLLQEYGEELQAKRIAAAIVKARQKGPITSTAALTSIIHQVVGGRVGKIDTATKTFQALRIAVNSELDALRNALPQAFEILASGGKLAVISFHSLEDRIVKQQFMEWSNKGQGVATTKKPIVATEIEQTNNPRSRSAKLRVFQKA